MRKLFIALLILGLVFILGLGVFVFFYYPRYVRPRIAYEEAVAQFERGEYVAAASKFDTMLGYANSAEYSKRAWLEAGYNSLEAGEYNRARTYFTKAEAEPEVFEMLDLAYFEKGKECYANDDSINGEVNFLCVSEGSPLREQMDSVRINHAERILEQDEYERAESVFAVCAKESYPVISGLWYDCGVKNVKIWDIANADLCFAKALNYSAEPDALQHKINEIWVEAGNLAEAAAQNAEAAGELEEAEENRQLADKCFARGNYTYDRENSKNGEVYAEAVALYDEGELFDALAKFNEIPEYKDVPQYVESITEVLSRWFVAGGYAFYATLDQNGHVEAHGDWEIYSSPEDWPAVEKLTVGFYRFMIGIKADGTVVGNGNDSWGNLKISDWHDIVQVACGDMHSVGLMSDGTVVACGRDYVGQVSHVKEWTDIKQIDAGVSLTVGLKEDGTVVACGENSHGECEVGFMQDIKQIACGASHVVGLKEDGTVVACGLNDNGQCNVAGWTDIVAIYCGAYHTVGLKSDGTLVSCGANSYGECNVKDYRDPICLSCGRGFTLMILKDGTIVKLGAINNVD